MSDTTIRPFTVDVPQADLDDLRDRLARTRWTHTVPDAGDTYGVSVDRVRHLVRHWLDDYDWRAWEARLNSHPQFTTEILGQRIHFLHVRSPRQDAFPLILTHGWPGTVVEYLDLIGPLTDAGYDVVIPSVPGSGFSGPTQETGWDDRRIARAWAELMARLGYRRYGAVGNDGGSTISPEVGRVDPDHCVGVHVAQVYSFPSGDPAEMADLTEDEQQAVATLTWFWQHKGAFNLLHAQQPGTLGHAMDDSPAGLAGWYGQLLGPELDDEFVLTTLSIHWFNRTGGSSMRIYYENDKADKTGEPTTVPLALAGARNDFHGIRRFAERDHAAIASWNVYDLKTHYIAHEAPDVVTADIDAFFSTLGAGRGRTAAARGAEPAVS